MLVYIWLFLESLRCFYYFIFSLFFSFFRKRLKLHHFAGRMVWYNRQISTKTKSIVWMPEKRLNFNFVLCHILYIYEFRSAMLIDRLLDKRFKAPSLIYYLIRAFIFLYLWFTFICLLQKFCCFGLMGASTWQKFMYFTV